MLKNWGAAFALASMIALGGIALHSAISSPKPPTKQSRYVQDSQQRPDDRPAGIAEPQSAESRIADYTWWLSAFTLLLAVVSSTQIFFLIRADQTARLSAEAAKKSAEALPAIERGYVFLRIARHMIQLRAKSTPNEHSPAHPLIVHYTFVNYGKTPAILREIRVGVQRSASTLPNDAWADQPRIQVPNDVLGAGEACGEKYLEVRDPEPMTDAVADQIQSGSLYVYFFGHVTYEDVFGDDQETQFCWRLDRAGFREWGGRQHNRRPHDSAGLS
jgi:hypothetical protein